MTMTMAALADEVSRVQSVLDNALSSSSSSSGNGSGFFSQTTGSANHSSNQENVNDLGPGL